MPAVNSPDPASEVRRPRLRVVVGGKESLGAFAAGVETNNRMQAARFDVSFALEVETDLTAAWWSNQKDVGVSVYVGMEQDSGETDWTLLVQGNTDHVHFHPEQNTVKVEGRDFASKLIDATTRETFANKRFSEIVGILAGRHGMTADVTPTTTLVGTYYQLEHDKLTLDGFHKATKEWDLLVFLAQAENYDLWVEGTVIHAHPAQAPDTDHPWVIRYTRNTVPCGPREMNATGLTCERSLTLAKDLKVTVKSFNGRGNKQVLATYPKGGKSASTGGDSKVQSRVFIRPNLTQAAAEKEAERLHHEITQNERVISVTMPGNLILTPRMMVKLEGTATSWDQPYYVDDIHRRIAWDSGFTLEMRCKNSSPKNETSVG